MARNRISIVEVAVIAVAIGALAAIAIPSWQAWMLRGQIEVGITRAAQNLDRIEKFYSTNGRLPRHAGEAGLDVVVNDQVLNYVTWHRSPTDPDRVGYLDVQMTLKPYGEGVTPFLLEARVAGNGLNWRCVSARRLGVPEENSVADFYLPSECRQGP